ncbi:MAG: tungstate ABC transporter substrate-binding protein WtpA [Thermoplasmatota archaeon]
MKKNLAIIIILMLGALSLSGCVSSDEKILNVYHAGSLSVPFDEIEKKFEDENPNVDVRRQGAGSVATVKKVTEQGKKPDIIGVADYSLIPNLMYKDDKASWTVRFAKNRMVVAYTEKSAHRDEISGDNWYEILNEDDVKFGFSNPNDDPCGYRSQMVTLLAESHYDDEQIFDNLIEENTDITAEGNNISVPEKLNVNTKNVMIRSAEVDLMSALEAGEIDYLFIYQSVAKQHEGVDFIQLPKQIDLSSVEYAEDYSKVTVTRYTGEKSVGKPIVYGITIPRTVENKELAVDFIKFLFSETGQQVLEKNGQPPIDPPKVDNINEVPDELKNSIEEG